VEEEKHTMSISIHTSHCWAVPCSLRLPCLLRRDEWLTTCSWHTGKRQHPRLSTLLPGERTYQAGGFPYAIVSCTTRAFTRGLFTRGFVMPNSSYIGKRGNVFTSDPMPDNPYVILFARYYEHILAQVQKQKKWKWHWLKPARNPPYHCNWK